MLTSIIQIKKETDKKIRNEEVKIQNFELKENFLNFVHYL